MADRRQAPHQPPARSRAGGAARARAAAADRRGARPGSPATCTTRPGTRSTRSSSRPAPRGSCASATRRRSRRAIAVDRGGRPRDARATSTGSSRALREGEPAERAPLPGVERDPGARRPPARCRVRVRPRRARRRGATDAAAGRPRRLPDRPGGARPTRPATAPAAPRSWSNANPTQLRLTVDQPDRGEPRAARSGRARDRRHARARDAARRRVRGRRADGDRFRVRAVLPYDRERG